MDAWRPPPTERRGRARLAAAATCAPCPQGGPRTWRLPRGVQLEEGRHHDKQGVAAQPSAVHLRPGEATEGWEREASGIGHGLGGRKGQQVGWEEGRDCCTPTSRHREAFTRSCCGNPPARVTSAPRTSFSSRCCRNTLSTMTRGRMGGSESISSRTFSAACIPATSRPSQQGVKAEQPAAGEECGAPPQATLQQRPHTHQCAHVVRRSTTYQYLPRARWRRRRDTTQLSFASPSSHYSFASHYFAAEHLGHVNDVEGQPSFLFSPPNLPQFPLFRLHVGP